MCTFFSVVRCMKQLDNTEYTPTKVAVLRRYVQLLSVLCVLLLVVVGAFLYVNNEKTAVSEPEVFPPAAALDVVPEAFEIPPFDDSEEGKMAAYGYRLITETYALMGPDTKTAYSGNRLACTSCHLNGGTKPYAAPFIGLTGVFPTYIGRENKIESLEERINGCFERSMNGKMIDVNSKEMRAMVSYIKHLSKDIPVGVRLKGQGFVDFTAPDRPADIKKGEIVYKNTCTPCHGPDGLGLKGSAGNREGGYLYPPLWGDDSYNDGAGMNRLITAARFIKGNMPLGVTHDTPQLSDEEAYDVAAYINSHTRPAKENKEHDYPNLAKKPKDCPYPPYADSIPQEQHRLGPFNFGA